MSGSFGLKIPHQTFISSLKILSTSSSLIWHEKSSSMNQASSSLVWIIYQNIEITCYFVNNENSIKARLQVKNLENYILIFL